jgi:TolB-like protein
MLPADRAGLRVTRSTANWAPPGSPSVGVLPFANPGGDSRLAYMSDRFADEFVTALGASSRYTSVVAAKPAPAGDGHDADAADSGRQLGVRYVLWGTTAVSGERPGVAARLTDVATGHELWASDYRCDRSNIDGWYAELLDRLVVATSSGMEAAELRRLEGRPVGELNAVEAMWVGTHNLGQVDRASLMRARQHFQHAVDQAPELLSGHGFLGATYTQEFTNGWNPDPSLLDHAWTHGSRAVDADTPSASGYQVLGTVHVLREEWEECIGYQDRSIDLDQHVMWPHALRGMACGRLGRWVEAAKSMHRALQLAPADATGTSLMRAYVAYRGGGREEAISELEKVRTVNPDNILSRVALTVFRSRQGELEEAKGCVGEILAVSPQMTVAWALKQIPGLEMVAGRREFKDYPRYLNEAGLPLR